MNFRKYSQDTINEGGNLTINTLDGQELEAQKIDMNQSTRKEFKSKSIELFKALNTMFYKKYGSKIWVDEKRLMSGEMFNGSTSFIFSDDYPDDEIIKYKTKSGDIDVIIPKEKAADLWDLLKTLEDKVVSAGVEYKGNNRTARTKLSNQINAIFIMHFSNGYKVPAQIDFEMLSVDVEGKPDEFARFAHSSTFEDMKTGQKGVAHKYLMISIAGGASIRDDIFVVTPTSTPEKYKIRTKGGKPYTTLTNMKFSVDHGLRSAFTKLDWTIDGKDVFIEKPSAGATYEQNLETIFEIYFKEQSIKKDIKNMWSFTGLLELMDKHLDKKSIELTYERMLARTIAKGAQPLERDSAELDNQIKSAMLNAMRKKWSALPDYTKMADEYYKKYGKR